MANCHGTFQHSFGIILLLFLFLTCLLLCLPFITVATQIFFRVYSATFLLRLTFLETLDPLYQETPKSNEMLKINHNVEI